MDLYCTFSIQCTQAHIKYEIIKEGFHGQILFCDAFIMQYSPRKRLGKITSQYSLTIKWKIGAYLFDTL